MLANASGFINGILQAPPIVKKHGDKGLNHYPSKALPTTHVRVRNTFLEPVLIEEETLSVSDRAATEPGHRQRRGLSYPPSDADGEAPAYVSVRSDDRQLDVRWVSLGSMRNLQQRPKLALAEALAEQHQLDRLGDPQVAKDALRERFPQGSCDMNPGGSPPSLKSIGTALHPSNCTECHFHAFKPGGCRAGKDCNFCHELHPRKNPRKNRRFMRRILGREAGSGTTATTCPPTDMNPEEDDDDDSSAPSTPRLSATEVAPQAAFRELNILSSLQKNAEANANLPATLGANVVETASLHEINILSSLHQKRDADSNLPRPLGPQVVDLRSSLQKNSEESSNVAQSLGLDNRPQVMNQSMPKEISQHDTMQNDLAKSTPPDASKAASQKSGNAGFISLRYSAEEPPACTASSGNGNESAPMMLNLVAGVHVNMPAFVDIAPEKQTALHEHLVFSASPPLPEGLVLDSKTGLISGMPIKVQETPTVHDVTVSVDAFGAGGIPLMMLALTSCQVVLRIVDLQCYTISWVRAGDESDTGDQIVLKLEKF
mmetsp:Transcript_49306/g.77989  ORF Transcript_49306/g.77989 Transcript_49306/m.77989 type:complete len:545 (-) Transcript_49306:282-1916(-)|eukprot:CAMPEP_0169068952 /NCGR_PEP_ID=MMETSP1015-20121227/4307_1 /TAXON_ID=342587 /ORGANISM="Karlodinium micrum, Strain CCMP2283" /LENGTH=544 /DNA_ID=CAMNT_0009127819 /DNA_START=39 /DNA_END=1673 /DNA_ORIENTATION=+